MTAILDYPQGRAVRAAPRRSPAVLSPRRPATVFDGGGIVALRQRRTLEVGSLVDRVVLTGGRMVSASDVAGHTWWIPAGAVWTDADAAGHPEQPRPIGLAVAPTRDTAVLRGLSDRLGWEAVREFERGRDLPLARQVSAMGGAKAIVLDGRLGHAVPTVVVLAADTMRWGAALTWESAMHRALYGEDPAIDPGDEIGGVSSLLAADDLAIASVDLGTPQLRAAGVARCSVQLVTANALVRSWDAP